MIRRTFSVIGILALSSAPALAHFDAAGHVSFAAGLSHPLSGADHMLAMLTVGLWAALLGGRAVWAVPLAFVGAMLLGFAMALAGAHLPFVEPVIAASVVVLGLLAMIALRVPTLAAMAMVGTFAMFHGHAHGGELGGGHALSFALGFAVSTALLHAVGVAAGLGATRIIVGRPGRWIARAAGGLAAICGFLLMAGT